MGVVFLGSILSLLFFSAVLAAELRTGDRRRVRELGLMVCVLSVVALYASHAVITGHWREIASLTALIHPGG